VEALMKDADPSCIFFGDQCHKIHPPRVLGM
jgi:hypothetical protein